MPKRIMHEFKLEEISAVDFPAQKGARMTIMKRACPECGKAKCECKTCEKGWDESKHPRHDKGKEEGGQFRSRSGHGSHGTVRAAGPDGNAKEVRVYVPTKEEAEESAGGETLAAGLDRIKSRFKGEGKFIDTGSKFKFEPNWDSELPYVEASTLGEFEAKLKAKKSAGDSGKSAGKSTAFTEGGNPMPNEMTVEDLQKQVTDLTQKLEAATVASSELEARASMSDVEKAHFDSLEGEAKASFGKLSATERKAVIVKAAEKDETIEIDGRTISKSKVGDDNFAVFKALQAETEKNRKEAADERARREMAEFSKRAEDELKDLPGETLAKAKVLKAMSGMEDADREVLETMLKSGSKAIKMAFEKLGHAARKDVNGDPMAFEKRVSEIASRDKIGKSEAMAVARREYPEEFAAYQGQN